MKKFLVVLLALAAVGGAFAQTPALTFGLYGDITATLAATDSYGIYTETYLTYAAKDMGLNATVIAQTGKVWNPETGAWTHEAFDILGTPRNYKFWYQVCSAAKVSVGALREAGSARLTSYIDGNGMSTRMANVETGVLTEMKVLPGVLTAAVFVPVTSLTPANDIKNSSIGLSFTLPNVATIVAAYRLKGTEVSAGVDLKAVKDTVVRAGVLMNASDPSLKSILYYTAGKAMGALNLGVEGYFYLKPAPKYGVQARVEYTMGSYVLGGRLYSDNYLNNGWLGANATIVKGYLKRNFAAGDAIFGLKYNVTTAAFSVPVDFEISF